MKPEMDEAASEQSETLSDADEENLKSEIRNPKSADRILEERAQALAKKDEGDLMEGEVLSAMAFPLGDEQYGIEINLVQEIQPFQNQFWSRVPSTPEFIVGAVNIRGRIYSVMDVGRFLGLPNRPVSENAHVILVKGGINDKMELCILADDVPQVTRIPLTEVRTNETAASTQEKEYIRGITSDMLIMLNLEKLLLDPKIIIHEEVL